MPGIQLTSRANVHTHTSRRARRERAGRQAGQPGSGDSNRYSFSTQRSRIDFRQLGRRTMSVFGVVVISLFAGQGLYPSASLPKLSHPGPNILTAIGDFLSHRYCCSRSCYANGSTCRRLKPRPIRSLVRWRGGRLKFLISYSHHSPVAKLNDENECGETCWSLMLSLSS